MTTSDRPQRSPVADDEHDAGQIADHAYELWLDRILGVTP